MLLSVKPLKPSMALSLRHTRTRLDISPLNADRQDLIEDGQVIGRIYEDRYVPLVGPLAATKYRN